jgi:hypothetical protein
MPVNMKYSTLLFLIAGIATAQDSDVGALLGKAVIDPRKPLVEAQVYEAARVQRIPGFPTAGEWEKYAAQLRNASSTT